MRKFETVDEVKSVTAHEVINKNGEYLRSSEIDEEQNYNMIDGRRNNMSPKGKNGRASVLAKLRRKQAEIAKRSGKPAPQMEAAEDMERRRK